MALTQPRMIYGIHSVSPYSRTDGTFYGILKVLENSNVSLSAENIGLRGGANRFEWAAELGDITSECSLSYSEYPDFVFTLFAGNAPTTNAAEATGNASTLTNKKGTSIMSATTGIASVTVLTGSEADLKFGKYVVKYASATTVDVYFSSDADIGRGTDGAYLTDALKILSALTITTGGVTTNLTGFGLKFTGGSGAIAFTSGDTATFEVRPINSGSTTVTIGAQADQNFPEFGMIIMAAKRGNQEMFEIDALKCKAAGLPIGFARNAWSKAETTIKLLYDQDADGVYKIRAVKPT